MPTIGSSTSGFHAVTQGVTNPGTPPATVMVLSDGEGNLVGSSNPASALLTYTAGAHATSNPGDSFSTSSLSACAVDVTVTGFTGGTSPSVTFFVERIGADGLWYRVWQSAAVSSAGTVSVSIGASVPTVAAAANTAQGVTAMLSTLARFGWSTSGSPTAVTFSGGVMGRS